MSVAEKLERAQALIMQAEARAWIAEKKAEQAQARVSTLGQALDGLCRSLLDLIAESEGVAGLHINGVVALWDELRRSEWLQDLDHAIDVLRSDNLVIHDVAAIENAKLFEAAPDLLLAAKAMLAANDAEDSAQYDAGLEMCRAAIGKAQGGQRHG